VTNEAFEQFIVRNMLQERVGMVLESIDPPEDKYRKIEKHSCARPSWTI